jgi:molecular chaperone DnaJ
VAQDDYYAVLGVDRRASAEEIKKAYRRLTLEYHPDRHPGDAEAERRYRQINAAYDVLGDAAARSRYDTTSRLQQGLDLSRGFDTTTARDLLGNVFGDVFRSRRRERRRGRDLRYTLTISLEEAALGSNHDIEFEAFGPCDVCKGQGTRPGGRPAESCSVCGGRGEIKGDGLFASWTRCGRCDGTGLLTLDPCEACKGVGKCRQSRSFNVRVPAGTESGKEKVVKGQGEPGRHAGEAGDLRITINIRPHRWLERDGYEIKTELPVSISEAAAGASLPVATVDGVVIVDVPKGVRSGTRLRLRGKGVPRPPTRRRRTDAARGDQLVTVVVETPVVRDNPELTATLHRLEELSAGGEILPRRDEQRRALDDPASA